MPYSDHLTQAKRVVIKIGSSLLVDHESGTLNEQRIAYLGEEISRLRQRGQQVLLVSSGAIALGRHYLKLNHKQQGLDYSQAAAASGQVILAHGYYQLMARLKLKAAQILLTIDDTEDRRRYLNARNTLDRLLEIGVVPVINENDSVATDEIRYGDNDRLAARVAQMMSAECLVLISDIDGLYTGDPKDSGAEHIATVTRIDKQIESLAGATNTDYGTGGMITKIAAAKICMPAGCATVIASGHSRWPLRRVEEGGQCTWFLPETTPQAARKRWIGGSLTPKGKIVIDDGAAAALNKGRSLLPVGVTQVQGVFDRGDAVVVCTDDGKEVARG
ncbi:MAG: glutamate 5-kinase, partial [Pseudomonadota bacterium]